jgi:hypothetical protein
VGEIRINIKSEDLTINAIKVSSDSNGMSVRCTSADVEFKTGEVYYIPFSNIGWIKYSKHSTEPENYIGNK